LENVELRRGRVFRRSAAATIKVRQRLGQDAADLARQTRIAVNEIPQSLRQDQDPLAIRHGGQQLIERVTALNDRALCIAAWANHAALAAVRNEPALATLTAEKARYAETGNAALQERPEGKLGAGI
jgi:hypothetical protein